MSEQQYSPVRLKHTFRIYGVVDGIAGITDFDETWGVCNLEEAVAMWWAMVDAYSDDSVPAEVRAIEVEVPTAPTWASPRRVAEPF